MVVAVNVLAVGDMPDGVRAVVIGDMALDSRAVAMGASCVVAGEVVDDCVVVDYGGSMRWGDFSAPAG